MPRRLGLAVVLLALGVVIGVTLRPNLAADPPKEEKKEKPIPIDEVRKRGVLGALGHPLGTIVTVEGEAFDGDETKWKWDATKTLLRVKTVDGTELKKEAVFHFHSEDAEKPKFGAKFKYTGYETGGYHGTVAGELNYVLSAHADVGYAFRTRFVILKDELKPEKK